MKILLAMNLPYYPAFGGANKCNRLLAEAMAQKKHRVHVVVPAVDPSGSMSGAEFLENLEGRGMCVTRSEGVYSYEWNGVSVDAVVEPARLRKHLLGSIASFDPDWVLVSCEEWSQGLLDAALTAARRRVAYLVHTLLFLPFGPQAFFPSAARTRLLERTAGIIVGSRFAGDYVARWSSLQAEVFHWPAYGSGPFPLLGKFNGKFVTCVNPSVGKGIAVFLELARRMPDVAFSGVPTWGTTRQDRAALEKMPNITLVPPCDDIDRILADTRVLVVPSLWQELFPLTIVEAMLRGIPVLAGNTGGSTEAKLGTDFVLPVQPIERFTEELDDRLLPVPEICAQREEDLSQWAGTLRALLSDRGLYERQSAQASDAALRFVAGLSFDRFEEILHRLASRPAPVIPQGPAPPLEDEVQQKLAALTPEQRAALMQMLSAQEDGASGS